MESEVVIKHYVKGRVRLKSEVFANAKNLTKIEKILSKKVIDFRANSKTNSITILFDELKLSLEKLLNLIESIFNIKSEKVIKIDNNIFSMLKDLIAFSLSGFGFIKTYIFGIKKVADTTMSVMKFGKFIRVI